MTNYDRRCDSNTSMKVAFVMRIKRAFGTEAARTFAQKQQLEENLAKEILDETNDRRQTVRRTNQRSLPRTLA